MRRAKDELKRLSVLPKKSRGQNFLIDPSVIGSIVEFGRPEAQEQIVEIGPGLGALTRELFPLAKLTVIEIEPAFCENLRKEFPGIGVICSDVREVDFSSIGSDLTVFGNLPYSFSTDIIFHLIAAAPSVKRAILMLQKEFVERLAASPGGKAYGALTVGCQLYADVITGPIVPGNSFHPPTNVDSMVLELRFLKEPRFPVSDLVHFRRVVKAAFSMRRKKLSNSLRSLGGIAADDARLLLEEAGIDPSRRAETVSVEEYAKLSNLYTMKTKPLVPERN